MVVVSRSSRVDIRNPEVFGHGFLERYHRFSHTNKEIGFFGVETTQQNTVRGSATIPERSETAFHAHHSNASERQVCAPLGANFMILRSRGGGFLKNQLRDRFQNSNQFLSAAGNRILDFLLKVPLVFLRKAHS